MTIQEKLEKYSSYEECIADGHEPSAMLMSCFSIRNMSNEDREELLSVLVQKIEKDE